VVTLHHWWNGLMGLIYWPQITQITPIFYEQFAVAPADSWLLCITGGAG